MRIFFLFLFFGFLTFPPTATAQGAGGEDPAGTAPAEPVSLQHLKLQLAPLTKDELLVEAEAWRDQVKAQVAEISKKEIADAEADLSELRGRKDILLERLDLVLDAYEEKGGDPTELRTYAIAVSGSDVDVRDVGATWETMKEWLFSKDGGIKWGLNLLLFFAIVFAFWILSRIAGRVVRKAITKNVRISHLLKQFINRLVSRAVLFIGLLVALSTVGFNVGALLALIGGGAFILGFALQETLGNFAAGMMLLIYRPFDVGDVVEVGGINGKVDSVSLVTTTIRTPDNKVVLVPNKKVWGEVITNASASPERRVDLVFGIGYEDDIGRAQSILESVTSGHGLVLTEPETVVRVHELADSSVNFICRPWVKTEDYWTVYWDLMQTVKAEFDKAEISIPFPQQDVHIHGLADAGKSEPEKKGAKANSQAKRAPKRESEKDQPVADFPEADDTA